MIYVNNIPKFIDDYFGSKNNIRCFLRFRNSEEVFTISTQVINKL